MLSSCVSAGLQVEAEQRVMLVAEGNSTYLECLPRSRHAAVTWYKQAGENSPELNQVSAHLLVISFMSLKCKPFKMYLPI